MQIKIRKARSEDIEEIVKMTEKVWDGYTIAELLEKKYGKIAGKEWYQYKKREVENFCKSHIDWVFVGEVNGKIIGYSTYTLDFERKIGEVGGNGVLPEFRGKGIGSSLHKKVLEEMRKEGMEIAIVSTLEIDIPAQRMYIKHGFQELVKSIFYTQKL
ncbi:MAG TPA: GNAT family N-acetyltransferase [Candidatus Ratteibacteria bacterium]|nr:GNAT family N-acetyltransferase [Candidatus Ratteibacteria bacterium]